MLVRQPSGFIKQAANVFTQGTAIATHFQCPGFSWEVWLRMRIYRLDFVDGQRWNAGGGGLREL